MVENLMTIITTIIWLSLVAYLLKSSFVFCKVTGKIIYINKIQQDATDAGIYLLQTYSTCFGRISTPSWGVYQIVTTASGTGHITYQGNDLLTAWPNDHSVRRSLSWYVIWPVPEAVVTIWCTPHGGVDIRRKHVQ